MSEKEWAVAYTDEQYLLRSEVVKAMNTSLIDGYWADIVAYRQSKAITFPFRSITNHPFFLTASEAIKAKITQFEVVSARFASTLKKISDPREKEQAERACMLVALRTISTIENAQMSELSLKALLNHTYNESNPFHAPVVNYHDALAFYLHDKSLASLHPNEDFLAEALGKCTGVAELTSFYRTSDFDSTAQRARYLYNPDYNYAPFDFIETLMGDFLSWLKHAEDVSYFVKAVASCYYLDYVMPFSERNDEMGALLAKAVYSTSEAGLESFDLPFEAILVKSPRYKLLALEAQRTGDLTYLVMYSITVLTPLLEGLNEEIKAIRIETYRGEFTAISPEEKAAATPKASEASAQQLSLFSTEPKPEETKKEAPIPVVSPAPVIEEKPIPPLASTPVIEEKPEPIPAPVPEEKPAVEVAPAPMETPLAPIKETPAPVVLPKEEKAPEAAPVPTIAKKEKPVVAPERQIAPSEMSLASSSGESALVIEENPLSDKEIKEYTQYLLETNPALNKNQAAFLASHSTLGRYYTIQQFKKFTRCAYETARTSMDKLAQEGYYSKLQVKNKFVYTPKKKGE
jgi:Fic family protein